MLDELLLLLFSHSVVSSSLQQTRLSCPSPSPGVSSNSCPLSQWCHPTILSSQPLLLLPLIIPSSRVFPKESALHSRWSKYWSFSLSISPSSDYSGLISFSSPCSPCCPRDSQEYSPTPQFKSINSSALSLSYGPTLTSGIWLLKKL